MVRRVSTGLKEGVEHEKRAREFMCEESDTDRKQRGKSTGCNCVLFMCYELIATVSRCD